jgi:hypothetical protein
MDLRYFNGYDRAARDAAATNVNLESLSISITYYDICYSNDINLNKISKNKNLKHLMISMEDINK